MPSPTDILDRLQKYLSDVLTTERLVLSRQAKDGRLNSQENEKQISHALELYAVSNEWFQSEGLKLVVAPPRHWFDFSVTDANGLFIPVNVKVSALKTSDNVSSKEGVFFALTGVQPNEAKINNWEQFCSELSSRLALNLVADYYFLVIGKDDGRAVFWTSLKQIAELVPNGNNPPFQCHWGKNRVRAQRPPTEANRYILRVLRETFRLRSEALQSFDKHLSDHLGDL